MGAYRPRHAFKRTGREGYSLEPAAGERRRPTRVALEIQLGRQWVDLGNFDAAVANQALRYAADRRVVATTMGFKHTAIDHGPVLAAMAAPTYLLKIPHVDVTPRICEIVRYCLTEIQIKGAGSGPGALDLHDHALAPVADLPVLEVLSTIHIIADLTLQLGEVVHDYLPQ